MVPVAAAAAPSVNVVSASTAMTSTTNFSVAHATASCASGTLVGGGDELTRSGALVSNDGNVTLGLNPSDTSGNTVAGGSTNPGSWTATAGYSGMAPGLDTVTSYAMCANAVSSATVVEVATSAANSLGPVTANCPSGDSLVGGGGGYTSFPGSNNTKIYDSYPSDSAGDVPTNGSHPTSWTVQGNSNSVTGATTTAVALCATDVSVPTEVETASNNDDNANASNAVAGGISLPTTATCPTSTTMLGGGSFITSKQNVGGVEETGGPGNGGQGVHVIGDFPGSSSSSAVASGSAGSAWTVVAQNGGQSLDDLNVEAFALCDTAAAPDAPTIGTATAGNASASVTFTAPSSNGGEPISSYTVTATDATNAGRGGQTVSGSASPLTVTGLTNGDAYTFSVTATNSVGTGSPSVASNAVTPQAAPTVSTQLSTPSPIVVGTSVSDQATLSGETATAGGTISYGVYSNDTCTTLVASLTPGSDTVTDGVAPASTAWTATPAGTYYFEATYSGDAGNTGPVSSPCTSETLVVFAPNTVSVSTQLSSPSPVVVATSVSDQATLAGETATAGGTITYGVYSNNTCTIPVASLTPGSDTVADGVAPASTAWTATPAGTYYFQATYSGDTNNAGPVSSPCTSETLVVNAPNTVTVSTQLSKTSPVTAGASVSIRRRLPVRRRPLVGRSAMASTATTPARLSWRT